MKTTFFGARLFQNIFLHYFATSFLYLWRFFESSFKWLPGGSTTRGRPADISDCSTSCKTRKGFLDNSREVQLPNSFPAQAGFEEEP